MITNALIYNTIKTTIEELDYRFIFNDFGNYNMNMFPPDTLDKPLFYLDTNIVFDKKPNSEEVITISAYLFNRSTFAVDSDDYKLDTIKFMNNFNVDAKYILSKLRAYSDVGYTITNLYQYEQEMGIGVSIVYYMYIPSGAGSGGSADLSCFTEVAKI